MLLTDAAGKRENQLTDFSGGSAQIIIDPLLKKSETAVDRKCDPSFFLCFIFAF